MQNNKEYTKMPDYYDIVHYWIKGSDKRIHLNFPLDLGEPTCFACTLGFNGKYDFEGLIKTKKQLNTQWQKAKLEKCHIIPKALGGSYHPSNLIPMCPDCHFDAPDSSFEQIFLDWFHKRKSWESRNHQMVKDKYTDDLDLITKYKWHLFSNRGKGYTLSKRFKKWLAKNSIQHAGTQSMLPTIIPLIPVYLKTELKKDVN